MSYTAPFTAVAGTAWKASDWNTYGRDNIAWLATDSPACRAYNNATVSLTSATYTSITMNSERFDNAAMHSTSSNTSRFTIPTGGAGKYLLGAVASISTSGAGNYRLFYLSLNGGAAEMAITHAPFSAGMGVVYQTPSTTYAMSVADYFELHLQQDSGSTLQAGGPVSTGPEAWLFWFRN